ncbi:MAG: CHAT domain-containing tetratricopeptide repeat protein [Cyanobacteria bacterium J06650_10]
MKDTNTPSNFDVNSQLDFLLEALQVTADSRNDKKAVYALLEANLDKLNDNFPEILSSWADSTLEEVDLKQAQYIAGVIGNFSNRVSNFLLGDRSLNRELSIVGCQIVSKVFSRESAPRDWAALQNNFGEAYFKRIRGDRGGNIEIAIRYYLVALEVFTEESFPWAWASVKNNLGNAYSERVRGEREENLEFAIHCYFRALKIRTQQAFPFDWADTQNNLGQVYSNRIYGERAKNLEAAIHCFLSSLQIHTREDSPFTWAQVQNNLGVAYLYRIYGQTADNLEVAIHSFLAALQIHTRDSTPIDWVQTQNNLGVAYSRRILGNRAENLELAIRYFLESLEVCHRKAFPQRWAETQVNLGFTYLYRVRGEKAENLESAIQYFSSALKVFTYQSSPLEWADTQGRLGAIYCYRIFGDRAENLKAAIHHFTNVLEVRTRDNSPQKWLEAQFNLGYAYQMSQQFSKAYASIANAIKNIDLMRDEIISSFDTQIAREKLADNYNQIYQCMVKICLELGYFNRAIEYVERSKTRNLVELIITRDRHTIFPPETVTQLDQLRDEIASGQYHLQNATAEEPTALAQHLQQLRQQRNQLQDQYLPIGSGFQLESFRSALSNRVAIIEFYITTEKLLVFIVTRQTQQPLVLPSDLVDLEKLKKWSNRYLKAYSRKKLYWQRHLKVRLRLLSKILHIDEIIEKIPSEYQNLILIPHRFLHLLPLHALSLSNGTSLVECFPGGISYAPSCQLLQLAQKRERPYFTNLFAIQNPTEDLTYTDLEVTAIQRFFNPEHTDALKKSDATKDAVDSYGFNTSHCIHFSCHGYFNLNSPRKSALILANSDIPQIPDELDSEQYLLQEDCFIDLNKCLTLDSIFSLNLDQCRLVTLSACETGLIDFRNVSDEYIGLPSGFLYAGARTVVSSLWAVNDLSTALLMAKFYENLQTESLIAIALNQAQCWLRDSTKADLEVWMREQPFYQSSTIRINLRRRLHNIPDNIYPFADPFYWAAFCAIGQP